MIALLDPAATPEKFSPHAHVNASRNGLLALAQPLPRESGSVSCIVPCYNEAANLEQLLPRLHETLKACTEQWEVILVDDGSSDTTRLVLTKWTQAPGFRALLLSRNFGKEAALMAGLEAAQGDAVVMMDSDLQHSPSLIPVFLQHWHQGRDVVYALCEDRNDESSFKRLGTRWFYRLVNMAGRFTQVQIKDRLPPWLNRCNGRLRLAMQWGSELPQICPLCHRVQQIRQLYLNVNICNN